MNRHPCMTLLAGLLAASSVHSEQMVPYSKRWDTELHRLPPGEVLDKLNLDLPGLEAVKTAAGAGDRTNALAGLLRHYRAKFPRPATLTDVPQSVIDTADRLCRHTFQWGPYEPADYGPDIDWTINPADDIEWVAAIYRFYWAEDLRRAYLATGDDKYVRAFMELTTDWIRKHPLDDWTRTHPTLTNWKGFAWLDLQTGIRETRAVNTFKDMLSSEAITPEFLAVFLASMYDHQHKTELVPMGIIHNKAIFEQRGFMNVCHVLSEFADTPRWAKLSLERARDNLLAQTTTEGIQREWCGSYHLGVLTDVADIMTKADDLHVEVPRDYRDRVRAMADYLFAVATPDVGWPMFGDTARTYPSPVDPRGGQLYAPLMHHAALWNEPRYAARAKRDVTGLPDQCSYAFETAGVYVMRSDWSPDGIYLALHCAPPPLTGHDQADNGTFELYAFGQWLLTDTGFYTYGHDREARNWHRQTRVHQTLTLDGRDTAIDGNLLLWSSGPALDALVVENPSYKGLTHRRTVWFVDKRFFVFLDEAVGDAPGKLQVHWTPAVGEGRLSLDQTSYTTMLPDANVFIHTALPRETKLETEQGWFGHNYGYRLPRTMLNLAHPGAAPAKFLTVIAPYRAASPPKVDAGIVGDHEVGAVRVEVNVSAFGRKWRLGRDLDEKRAWCEAADGAAPAADASPAPHVDVDRLVELGSPEQEDEFPAIATDRDGIVWACWIGFDGESDAVFASKLEDGKPGKPIKLSDTSTDHWRPQLCPDAKGGLWATWARCDAGRWSIWGRLLADGTWSTPMRLTPDRGNHFAQKLAVGPDGRVWMTWQSSMDGNHEVYLAPITPKGAGKPHNVSHHPAGDWEPTVAVGGDGMVYVAWDSYRGGSYDVLVRIIKDELLLPVIGVATTPAYEAHAALAVDREDRVWIAWDNGGLRWGQDNEEDRKLHSERRVELRCFAGGDALEPLQPLSEALSGPLASFTELPELTIDGAGRLWLFVRHLSNWTPDQRPGERIPQTRGIWNPYALCLQADGWSRPKQLPDSNGRNDMRVSTCVTPDGKVWAAYAHDGRRTTRTEEPINHDVRVVRLDAPASGDPAPLTRGAGAPALIDWKPPTPWTPADRPSLTINGKPHRLLYGDLHRHTDISRCGMNVDGSLIDTYRYATDVARLDFLAITDHDQDILKHRYGRPASALQHYSWWRSEKYADLFHIDSVFIAMYGYEHGGSFEGRGGHKNVIYLERGNPCYEQDSPEKLFDVLVGKDAIAIPHQLADGPAATDWTQWKAGFERVAEIYQARGSYEYFGAKPELTVTRRGHYYQDALEMGVRIGVIASSDHGLVSKAYACVYAPEVSRAGVMEALRNRRTFGAMDRMLIELRLGDHAQGEEVELDAAPTFSVRVEAPAPLGKVQLVRNGTCVHTVEPGSTTCRFDFTDRESTPGTQAWYYLRVEQDNDRYGWSSPIWVGRKPDRRR